MKTKEELNALKAEFEALNRKFAELTGDELKTVSGGFARGFEYREPDRGADPKLWGQFIISPTDNDAPELHQVLQ